MILFRLRKATTAAVQSVHSYVFASGMSDLRFTCMAMFCFQVQLVDFDVFLTTLKGPNG